MSIELQQLRGPTNVILLKSNQKRNHRFCYYCKKPGRFKQDCHKLKWDLGGDNNKQDQGCSEDYERVFPLLLTNAIGEIEITIGEETLKVLVDAGATFSVLNPTLIHCPLPRSKQIVQLVGVSNFPMQVFKSEPVIFQLTTITGKNVFLLVKCAPIHLIGRDLLEAYNVLFTKG